MHLSMSSSDESSLMLRVDATRVDYVQSVRSVIHICIVAAVKRNKIQLWNTISSCSHHQLKKLIYKLTTKSEFNW